MSTPRDNVPPHYQALRVLWTALQVILLLVVVVLVVRAVSPGDLIGDFGDWARDL